MYLGNLVEVGKTEQIFGNPSHPYTRALLSAIPRPDPELEREGRIMLEGDVPSPMDKPSGCGFRTRCPIAQPSCAEQIPPMESIDEGHEVACPYHDRYQQLLEDRLK